MDQPGGAPQNVQNVYQPGGDGANVPLAVVGAALGAAVGGGVWFAIEHFAHYQIGFIAILCGAAAGWGAVVLGKGHGFTIGVIAAAFGLLGVVGGSYGSFVAAKGQAKDELATEAEKYPGFSDLPAAEKEAALAVGRAAIDEIGYVDYMKQDKKNMAWMALFGVIGLAYGFSVGNGGLNRDSDSDDYDG
jgi:hypothetical protein